MAQSVSVFELVDCLIQYCVVFTSVLFREKQAIARGKLGEDSAGSAQAKKKKLMKRIHEWQRFEENCNLIKDFDEEKILKLSELQKEMSQQSTPVTARTSKSKEV